MTMISKSMENNAFGSQEKIDKMAERLAEELSKKMYYEFILMKNIPEIERIKIGSDKALKNKDARDFLEKA
jgi:hypothetical protein